MDCISFKIEIDVICIIVLLMVRFGNAEMAIKERAHRAFQHLIDFSICFCVLNSVSLFIPPSSFPLLKVTNCLKVILCIFMGCSWFLTVFYTTSTTTYTLRKWAIPIIVPSLIVSAITIAETCVHISDQSAEFSMVVWFLLNILSILYITAASILCLTKARKSTNRFYRRRLYVLSFVMLFPLFSLILQAKLFNMPITSTAFALITLFLHLYGKNQRITIDSITGLNNTNKLASYLERITQSQDPAKRLFFLDIEMDNFRASQRRHSRESGTMAIQAFASFLSEQCSRRGIFLARYKYAAFAIIIECNDFSEVEAFTNRMTAASSGHQLLTQAPWPIKFSIHWAEYGTLKTRTIDGLLDTAEKNCIKPAST